MSLILPAAIPFPDSEGVLPEEDKVYAYNIYPGTVPHFKLFFNGATSKVDGSGNAIAYVVPYQYAVVNSYNSGSLTNFKAGTIYRVTLDNLVPANLATKEDGTNGDVEFGIDVTVVKATWDVEDVEGSWSQN